MGKMLIIAEKPSVAREIAAALGGFSKKGEWLESEQAIVSSGIGHLVEIHASEADSAVRTMTGLPIIPARFELRPIERTKSQLLLLRKLMNRQDVNVLVNACDAGREGELIFRLIHEWSGVRKPVKRMWLQSMTAEAIRSSYRQMRPGSEFDALGEAACCRSEADWLIGINGTRGISYMREQQAQHHDVMTAGRVQTPTLAIIVHRERAIRDFVPQDYWELHGTFQLKAGTYVAKWIAPEKRDRPEGADEQADGGFTASRIMDKGEAQRLLEKCRGVAPQKISEESRLIKSQPPRLFDLTSLQRDVNKRFRLSAKRTLDIAQALYEKHKALTYPRTDSMALPEDYVEQARQVMEQIKGQATWSEHAKRAIEAGWISKNKRIFDDAQISDHFAIIPTGKIPEGLDPDEARVYDLVVRRFVAAFHPAAQHQETVRLTVVAGETFRASGKVLVEPGWLQVYGQGVDGNGQDDAGLCAYEDGEPAQNLDMTLKSLKTTPPPRFTEATLLSAMECAGKFVSDETLREAMKEKGLGTPATRAAIIEGLLATKGKTGSARLPYLTREGKAQHLVPTEKAEALIGFLEQHGVELLASPDMTGVWEQKLRQMERGSFSRSDFMADVVSMTRQMIEVIKRQAASTALPVKLLNAKCPSCGSTVATGARSYECKAGCGFRVWREVASRRLSEEEAEVLIGSGKTDLLDGFISKAGRKFSAALVMDDGGKISFVFAERGDEQHAGNSSGARSPGKRLEVVCPSCRGTLWVHSGEKPRIACDKGDFTLWQNVAGRALSDAEALRLIKEKSLPALDGFFSAKTGKRFSAGLALKRDGKVEFVFKGK